MDFLDGIETYEDRMIRRGKLEAQERAEEAKKQLIIADLAETLSQMPTAFARAGRGPDVYDDLIRRARTPNGWYLGRCDRPFVPQSGSREADDDYYVIVTERGDFFRVGIRPIGRLRERRAMDSYGYQRNKGYRTLGLAWAEKRRDMAWKRRYEIRQVSAAEVTAQQAVTMLFTVSPRAIKSRASGSWIVRNGYDESSGDLFERLKWIVNNYGGIHTFS